MLANDGKVYGPSVWKAWRTSHPENLWPTRQEPTAIWREAAHIEVRTYRDFFEVLSFLKVMNKERHLLLRGQKGLFSPLPSLLRPTWRSPSGHIVRLDDDRAHYWRTLNTVGEQIADVLLRPTLQLPRHRPFENWRESVHTSLRVPPIAPWSVIQHYELWPTPLIDLTDSARIAASFALGLDDGDVEITHQRRTRGYVDVFAIPTLTSDVMELRVSDARKTTDAEQRMPVTVRLSAVCPHNAVRPHLQEGYLCGYPDFGNADLAIAAAPVLEYLTATFELIDETNTFFSPDFPRHTSATLLPTRTQDELLESFLERIRYDYTPLDASCSHARVISS